MSIERQAVGGLKWTALAKVLTQLFAWSVTLVVMRLLEPSDYGLMAMVSVVIGLAATAAELGLGASIVQARSLPQDRLRQVCGAVVVLNVAVALATVLLAPLVAWGFAEPRLLSIVQVAALQFLFTAVSSVPDALLARDLAFKRSAGIELISAVTMGLATLAFALLGHGVWALVYGNLAGAAGRALLLLLLAPRVRPSFMMTGVREHLHYGGMLTMTRLGLVAILQSDVVIASRHLSQSAIGAYSVGLHLATLPMQKITSVVNHVAFSAVARLQEEPDRLRDGLLKAFRLSSLVSVPVLWGLSACAPELVRVALGPKWEAAVLPVQVMSVVIPLRMVSGLMWTAISAIGRVDIYLKLMIISAVVFPLSFFTGVQWGLTGLAIAWPIAWLLNFVLQLPRMLHTLGISVQRVSGTAATPLLAGLPMAGAILLCRLLTPDLGDLVRLLLMIAIGATVYGAAISTMDRTLWAELRRVLVMMRG